MCREGGFRRRDQTVPPTERSMSEERPWAQVRPERTGRCDVRGDVRGDVGGSGGRTRSAPRAGGEGCGSALHEEGGERRRHDVRCTSQPTRFSVWSRRGDRAVAVSLGRRPQGPRREGAEPGPRSAAGEGRPGSRCGAWASPALPLKSRRYEFPAGVEMARVATTL